jgi:hypothetical protein
MFFDRKSEMREFREELPGRYRCLALTGLHTPLEDIDFEDLWQDTRTFGLPTLNERLRKGADIVSKGGTI